MNKGRCRNLEEFKVYIEGFQTGKGGRPPNAIEWAEIIEVLKNVQPELVDAIMPIAGQLGIPSIQYTPPIELEKDDLGVLKVGSSTPRTFGNRR